MKGWINPLIAQENPLKTSLENIKWIFFAIKNPKLGKQKWENEEHLECGCSPHVFSSLSTQKMREDWFLKCKKKPLI